MELDGIALAEFAAADRDEAVARLARLLTAYFPDARAVPTRALRAGVAAQIKRAGECGLTAEAHVAQYVIASWLLGRDFDVRFPEARRVLRSRAYAPDRCAAWLQAWTPAVLDGLEED